MGYRSDVRITTTEEGYAAFLKECDKQGAEYPLASSEQSPQIVEREKGCVIFGWNWVKWYDHYDDVQAVMRSLEAIGEAGHPWYFARIGEDFDDWEEQGDTDGLTVCDRFQIVFDRQYI